MKNPESITNTTNKYSQNIFAICEDFRQRLEELNRLKRALLKDEPKNNQ
jgi:hypothetical protein